MDVREEVIKALEDVESREGNVPTVHAELMSKLEPYINHPRLGFATTIELINELQARVDIAHLNGEEWPVYRAKDS